MKFIGKRKIIKLAKKNRGNVKLQKAIKLFEKEITESTWTTQQELESSSIKFDSVHSDGFYIADIHIYRAMIAITYVSLYEIEALKGEDENIKDQIKALGEVEILWVGTHDGYQRIFGDNKDTIQKWLRAHGHIS